jgi:hypothetical protein
VIVVAATAVPGHVHIVVVWVEKGGLDAVSFSFSNVVSSRA